MNKRRKILIVDDTEINIELLADILKSNQFDVVSANDGIEALAAVERHKPDLILLDVQMPRMDGYEVCERLKKDHHTETIPICMVTALQDLQSKIRAIEVGADDFLTKPFNKVDLLSRVRSLLRITELWEVINHKNEEIQKFSDLQTEFMHKIIHDLQSPLTVISMSTYVALQHGDLNTDVKKNIEDIQQASQTIQLIIRNILSVEQMEHANIELKREEFSLRDLLHDNISNFKKLLKENEKIEEEIPPALPVVNADKDLLSRIVTNLLHNALKNANKKGREIKVSALLDLKGGVQVTVADNGPGLSVEEKDFIFGKFEESLKLKARKSVALGLTFCRMAIELHGGKIWVDSTYGKGASFSFIVPLK
ncbi:MAG: response regulator [Bacteroidota bacterium]